MHVQKFFAFISLAFILSSTGLLACNHKNNGNGSPRGDYAGVWVVENDEFYDGDLNGFSIDESGRLFNLSIDPMKSRHYANLQANGELAYTKVFVDEIEANSGEELEVSTKTRLEFVDRNTISVVFSFKVTNPSTEDGELIETQPAEEWQAYSYNAIRKTSGQLNKLKSKLNGLLKNSKTMIATLAGSKWELVEKYDKWVGDSDEGYTTPAKDVEDGWNWTDEDGTKHREYFPKTLDFVDRQQLIVNKEFLTEYNILAMNFVAHMSSRREYQQEFGEVILDGDSLILHDESWESYTRNNADGSKELVEGFRVNRLIYRRVN